MITFSTTGRVLGFVAALVLITALRPMFGKDYGSLGLWSALIFMAVMLVAYGIETAIKRMRR
jgi:hypothetical protein